jgi:hypothetical protein
MAKERPLRRRTHDLNLSKITSPVLTSGFRLELATLMICSGKVPLTWKDWACRESVPFRAEGTIRGIARRAKVDPSLVMQHHGSKGRPLQQRHPARGSKPGEIEAHLHDVLDVRLVALPPETRALVRSMLTAPEAAAHMSAFLNERAANLSRAMSGDDADLRAALTVRSILGLIIARHFLQLHAFAPAFDAEIARVARPWVTTGVDPTIGQRPALAKAAHRTVGKWHDAQPDWRAGSRTVVGPGQATSSTSFPRT